MSRLIPLVLVLSLVVPGVVAAQMTNPAAPEQVMTTSPSAASPKLSKQDRKRAEWRARGWSDATIDDILDKTIRIGMTMDQVIAAWGHSVRVNTTITASGEHAQWVYGIWNDARYQHYVYFENGILTAIQQ